MYTFNLPLNYLTLLILRSHNIQPRQAYFLELVLRYRTKYENRHLTLNLPIIVQVLPLFSSKESLRLSQLQLAGLQLYKRQLRTVVLLKDSNL